MSGVFAVTADDVIEQLVIQCWLFEARDGHHAAARAKAERTLERLLSRGLPHERTAGGQLALDPYAAANAIKVRASNAVDEAWQDWQVTTRRNAVSLPAAPHRYRMKLRREWRHLEAKAGRPLILRLPLPLRGAQRGTPTVRLVEHPEALLDRRDEPGRVELRLDPKVAGEPVVAELVVDFVSGERCDDLAPSTSVSAPPDPADAPWLRDREGLVTPCAAITARAAEWSAGRENRRDVLHAFWDRLLSTLRFGDVHRGDLAADEPLATVLETGVADCVLGSSLLIALCRARGIPARLVTGYLLHPANIGPHAWVEARVGAEWAPFDFGAWCYCAGDPHDPEWGHFFRGRVDARFVAEALPRDFTGWGSAPPPDRWFRLERLRGDRIVHTLHRSLDGALVRSDEVELTVVSPEGLRE